MFVIVIMVGNITSEEYCDSVGSFINESSSRSVAIIVVCGVVEKVNFYVTTISEYFAWLDKIRFSNGFAGNIS